MTTPSQSSAAADVKPTAVDNKPADGDIRWVCRNCHAIYLGDDTVASQHFEDLESWGHWLFECRYDGQTGKWIPTKRSIHTSDLGGYYFDDWVDLLRNTPASSGYRPDWERFTALLDQS